MSAAPLAVEAVTRRSRRCGADVRRGRRLGVDVGRCPHRGRVSDPSGILATPVETVARVRTRYATRRPRGRASSDRGRRRPAAGRCPGAIGRPLRKVRAFADELAAASPPMPVRLVDERMSTVTATASCARRASGEAAARRHRPGGGRRDPAVGARRRADERPRPGDLVEGTSMSDLGLMPERERRPAGHRAARRAKRQRRGPGCCIVLLLVVVRARGGLPRRLEARRDRRWLLGGPRTTRARAPATSSSRSVGRPGGDRPWLSAKDVVKSAEAFVDVARLAGDDQGAARVLRAPQADVGLAGGPGAASTRPIASRRRSPCPKARVSTRSST